MGFDNGTKVGKRPKALYGYQYNPSSGAFQTLVLLWRDGPVPSLDGLLMWNFLVICCIIAACEILPRYGYHEAKGYIDECTEELFKVYGLWFPFIAMVSGFYNATAYNRWWHMRNSIRTIMGGGVLVSMFLAAEIKPVAVRKEICRYIAQAQAILAWTFRTFHADKDGDGDADAADIGFFNPKTGKQCLDFRDYLDMLEDKGICTSEERKLIAVAKAPFHLSYEWALSLLSDAVNHGDVLNPISAPGLIQNMISTQRGAGTSVLMHLSTPTPFPYFFLFRFITLVTAAVAPYAIAGISTKGIPSYPMEVLGTLVTTFWAGSMWTLGQDMSDPFGMGVCDFDLVDELAKAEALMAQQIHLPETYPGVPTLYPDKGANSYSGVGVMQYPGQWDAIDNSLNSLGSYAPTAPSWENGLGNATQYPSLYSGGSKHGYVGPMGIGMGTPY